MTCAADALKLTTTSGRYQAGGIELAIGLNGDTFSRTERIVLVAAGIALWNMGVAYLAGEILRL